MNIEATEAGVTFDVKVVPGGSRDELAGPLGDALKVKVSAPPEGGRANDAVRDLLAKTLGLPKRSVSIVSGASRLRKRILARGVDCDEAGRRLLGRTGAGGRREGRRPG